MLAIGDACAAGARDEAERWYLTALDRTREVGDRFREADALHSLGRVTPAGPGVAHLRAALAIFQELHHPRAEGVAADLAGRRGPRRQAAASQIPPTT
jgi:hypothetical protein